MFLAIVSYVLGVFMETFVPRRGLFRFLNPVNQVQNVCYFILKATFAGTIQQEGKCFYCHHGKRLCQLRLGYRNSRCPAVSEHNPFYRWNLMISAKGCTIISPPILVLQCSCSS